MADEPPADAVHVPFPGGAHVQTNPDRLAAIGTLCGMTPAPPERCRMLELGCGEGVNLLAAAIRFPGSRFVGADRAPRALARARQLAERLSLTNVEFVAADFGAVPAGAGPFDYVSAHGVYSWISPPARDELLAACARHVAPGGIVHVSYGALPGHHVKAVARDVMLFHVRGIADEDERARAAVDLARFLAGTQTSSPALTEVLSAEYRRIASAGPAVAAHDEIAPFCDGTWFSDFCAHARRHGLAYLAEAEWATSTEHYLAPEIRDRLDRLAPDAETRLQYLDFIQCRRFHHTLLVRGDAVRGERPSPQVVRTLRVSSAVRLDGGTASVTGSGPLAAPSGPADEPDAASAAAIRLVSAAMEEVAERRPERIAFDELLARARARFGAPAGGGAGAEDEAAVLAEALYDAFEVGLVGLHVEPTPCVVTASARPVASPLARLLVRDGEEVPSLLHDKVRVGDAASRTVLALLDGTRDRAAILAALRAAASPVPEIGPVRVALDGRLLDDILEQFARSGLLLA
jgi:SAM-dependent methyltransferase